MMASYWRFRPDGRPLCRDVSVPDVEAKPFELRRCRDAYIARRNVLGIAAWRRRLAEHDAARQLARLSEVRELSAAEAA